MTEIKPLIMRSTELINSIANTVDNLKKLGQKKYTRPGIKIRINRLREVWNLYDDVHKRLLAHASSTDKELEEYFAKSTYSTTETLYLEQFTEINAILDSLPRDAEITEDTEHREREPQTVTIKQLPNIDLPRFSGDYLKWPEFRDLFYSKIGTNTSFTNGDRMYYLKMNLHGEASDLIKNYPIEGDSFIRAWEVLKTKYNNTRLQVMAKLSHWASVKQATSESAAELQRVLNATNNLVEGMAILERPTISDDILVYYTAGRLDRETKRDWDASLGATKDPPTYKQLKDFLNGRICMLAVDQVNKDSKETSSSSSSNREQRRSGSTVRTHHTTPYPYPCILCSKKHPLCVCDKFKAKTVPERNEYVREKHLCPNCLGSHAGECKASKSCFVCGQRHHTTLHQDSATPAVNSYTTTAAAQPIASNSARLDSPQHVLVDLATPFAQTILPTALVDIIGRDGCRRRVRALIDQGSQCSFVASAVAKDLELDHTRANMPVSGIGGSQLAVARSQVSLKVASRHNPDYTIKVQALTLPHVSGYYSPICKRFIHQWKHLQGLQLADDPEAEQPIELLLGSEVYARILLAGIRQEEGNDQAPLAQNTRFGWIISGGTPNIFGNRDVTSRATTTTASISTRAHHLHLASPYDYHSPDSTSMSSSDIETGRMFKINIKSKL